MDDQDSYYDDDYQSDYGDDETNLSNQQILELVQNLIQINEIQKAELRLKKIQSPSKHEEYLVLILRSIISMKKNEFEDGSNLASQALQIEKNDILPYKVKLYCQKKEIIDKFIETLELLFQNVKPDIETMILISSKLHQIAKKKDSVMNLYFNAIRDDHSLIPALKYAQPSKKTYKKRIEILNDLSQNEIEACSILIQTLISEKGLINNAAPLLHHLPKNHPTRLLFKILFGKNPVEKAKILCSQEGNDQHFKNFIKYYEEKNYIALKRFVENEPFFASGWFLLADLAPDETSKYIALQKSYEIHERKEIKQKLEEYQGTLVVLDNKGEDVIANSSPEDQRQFNEAQEIWNKYEETKDKNVLKQILEMKSIFLIAKIKINAILKLRDVIGDDEVIKQLESIKEIQYRKIYNIIGHFYLDKGMMDEAVKNFVEDANYDSEDPVCLDIASRKFIEDEDIEKALALCLKAPDHEWAIFRAGLIYQRLGKHREAVSMFLKIIRNRQKISDNNNNNDNAIIKAESSDSALISSDISMASIWKVVAQSYALMNRYMALKDVLAELRSMGSPDLDYESLYDVFHENNISIDHNYDINTSPLRFHNFLRQITTDIKMLRWQGRSEACSALVNKYQDIVHQFAEKWGKLGAILKAAGDFFLEGFVASGNQDRNLFAQALGAYKKRAEVDLVPESFVDIANALHLNGNDEQALAVLRRVLSKYPDSQIIWVNLGVLYALQSKLPFARHCFIAASRVSFDSQNGKVYSFIAAVEKALNDLDMMERAIRVAEEMNMMDVSLLQLKGMNGRISHLDASLCIYEGEIVSPNLPRLCIQNGKFVEALGYALMLNNNEEIAFAYEALGKYEQALQFAENEEQRNRLSELIGKNDSSSADTSPSEAIDSAINKFKEGNDLISKLTTAALYISKNNKNEAYIILKTLLENSKPNKNENPNENNNRNDNNIGSDTNALKTDYQKIPKNYLKLLLSWLLQIAPSDQKFSLKIIDSDPLLFFLNLRRTENEGASVLKMYKKFVNNPYAIKLFTLLSLKNNYAEINLATVVSAAESLLSLVPKRESYKILIAAEIRAGQTKEAKKLIQHLQILDPNEIPRTIELLKKINK